MWRSFRFGRTKTGLVFSISTHHIVDEQNDEVRFGRQMGAWQQQQQQKDRRFRHFGEAFVASLQRPSATTGTMRRRGSGLQGSRTQTL